MRRTPYLQLNTRIEPMLGTRFYSEIERTNERAQAGHGQKINMRQAIEQAIECWLNMRQLQDEYTTPELAGQNEQGASHAQPE